MSHGQSPLRLILSLPSLEAHPSFRFARTITQGLKKANYEAVLAGGSVRDALLGLRPKDFDIATSAPPQEVERLFRRTIPVGRAFGTMIVEEHGHAFEVTTF